MKESDVIALTSKDVNVFKSVFVVGSCNVTYNPNTTARREASGDHTASVGIFERNVKVDRFVQ